MTTARAAIRPFSFDRTFHFGVPAPELWETLSRTDDFPAWWRWLRTFSLDGASRDGREGLAEGVEADCVVRGPLPYALRFTVAVTEVKPAALVATEVTGDIEGPARLELRGVDGGTEARLVWAVRVVDPALRATARVARPLMEWGHDLVVNRGVRQFRRHALDEARLRR